MAKDEVPPEERQRAREREALRRSRELLDDLEREEARRRSGYGRSLLLAAALTIFVAAGLFGYLELTGPPRKSAERIRCESQEWTLRQAQARQDAARIEADGSLDAKGRIERLDALRSEVRQSAARACETRGL